MLRILVGGPGSAGSGVSPVCYAEYAFCGDPENSGHLLPVESNAASPRKFLLVVAETKTIYCYSLHKTEFSMCSLITTKTLSRQIYFGIPQCKQLKSHVHITIGTTEQIS